MYRHVNLFLTNHQIPSKKRVLTQHSFSSAEAR